jgi:hypothetical protein
VEPVVGAAGLGRVDQESGAAGAGHQARGDRRVLAVEVRHEAVSLTSSRFRSWYHCLQTDA